MCTKRTYRTKSEAVRVVAEMRRTDRRGTVPYRCRECGAWVVGNTYRYRKLDKPRQKRWEA